MTEPRDQAGDIHQAHEATGGTGVERPTSQLKDPEDWTTGDEPMTDAQRSYLTTLSQQADEDPPGDMTKAEASRRIDELQQRTGRGVQR